MIVLIVFAFLAGIVTILSPCILPILPIILSSTVDTSGKRRPLGVVTGFVLSFTFFTLFLSTLVRISGISGETLRHLSILILVVFGMSLVLPGLQEWMEINFSKITRFAPNGQNKKGFAGGVIVGLSLGLLWTPCVGPILASVISLAISGTVTAQAAVITLAYAMGTAIPMFLIMMAGSTALKKVPGLLKNSGKIQRGFGILMVIVAVGIFFNVDRQFQTWILNTFPQYGVGLTRLEDNETVRRELDKVNQWFDESMIGKPMLDSGSPVGPVAAEIIAGGAWLNSEPLRLSELKGKVVIIDFWTYSCINCQRTFPYLKSWWDKYRDQGLVIIGVHSPEFEFEKSEANVRDAIEDFGIEYPVVQDNNFATWKAYDNRYWPAKYIIDKDGHVRYTHFGEGEYDETEKVIQELLKETGAVNLPNAIENPKYDVNARTPETYLGYQRIESFGSPENLIYNKVGTYSFPEILGRNLMAFSGNWVVTNEYANPLPGSELKFNFDAQEVYLVMRAKSNTARVKVYLDDKVQYTGEDVFDGIVTVDADRLYKLIKLPSPERHILKLEFLDGNAEIYAFTFG